MSLRRPFLMLTTAAGSLVMTAACAAQAPASGSDAAPDGKRAGKTAAGETETGGNGGADPYFIDGQQTLARRKAVAPIMGPAKNVILFVADGMDLTTITATRIFDGQSRGEDGEENFLSFERFPHVALSKTYNTDAQTPDSAGTMTAMATGVKTRIGMVSVGPGASVGDCAAGKAHSLPTFGELAEQAGLSTGVISTARLTHATPAAVYAHAADRDWERDTSLSTEARAQGCTDIAAQLIDFPFGDGIDFAMGGGRSNFLTAETADPEDADAHGARRDGRQLTDEWAAKSEGHRVVYDLAGFEALPSTGAIKPLGLFERSHMEYEADRAADAGGEPSIAAMTGKAIDLLSQNENGFVLLVEGGRVDHAHHGGNAARALRDAQAFAEAVAVAREKTRREETLIIVTADHGHTLTFAGYPSKGNDILGLVTDIWGENDDGLARASDGKPYTTLGYANGPGSVFFAPAEDKTRKAPGAEEVSDLSYRQQATIPTGSETHGGQDVTIYADGPGAWLFGGVVEQSYIFHVIDDALSLRARAGEN